MYSLEKLVETLHSSPSPDRVSVVHEPSRSEIQLTDELVSSVQEKNMLLDELFEEVS